MGISKGKQFEHEIQEQFEKVKELAVLRLYDVTMGYKNINNPCDFIFYKKPKLAMIECKAIQGHLLNFAAHIRENQWEKLLKFSRIDGIEAGVLVWFYDKNRTYYINIQELELLKQSDKKSFDCLKDTPTVILYGKKKKVFYNYCVEKFIKELFHE